MSVAATVGILLTLIKYFVNGENLQSTVVFSPSELLKDSHFLNNSLKLALRYGFQRTSDCKDFSKAFICVQKCLDLGFDVANSNRNCFCTCYHKRGKGKTNLQVVKSTKTKWRYGAPTTKLPAWALKKTTDGKLHNKTEDIQYIVEGTLSDIVNNQTEETTLGTETPATGDTANTTDVPGVNTGTAADNATNVTGGKEDGPPQTGGTGTPKEADHVTGTGSGNANATIQDSSGTNGAVVASNSTGGTESGTKVNDATSGGTEKPKADTAATTGAATAAATAAAT